jgi:hypothetical protein
MKYIGVLLRPEDESVLKRTALLCDEIVCDVADRHESVRLGIVRADLDHLCARALETLNAVGDDHVGVLAHIQQVREAEAKWAAAPRWQPSQKAVGDMTQRELREEIRVIESQQKVRKAALLECHDRYVRLHAYLLHHVYMEDVVVPVLQGLSVANDALFTKRAGVVRVVMNHLPLPDDRTPWDAIADWRSDPAATGRYRVLRAWISRMARERLSTTDIEEEFAALLADYERYMAVHHRRIARGRFEAIILPIAEALEDISRFRLASAVQKMLSIFKDEVRLMEAEFNAPGREVAYIATAKQHFTRTT